MHKALLLLALPAAACASAPDVSGRPDFTPIAVAASPNARFYADCIGEAARTGRYGHAYDEVHVVIFTCEGPSARAFFEALGPWSVAQGSEVTVGDRVIRATTRIERDLFAADWCQRQGEIHRCSISLRAGEFARP